MTVEKGIVKDVALHPEHGKAEVTLTIETESGFEFTESYDMAFNMARAVNFSHTYGPTPMNAEGISVNVYMGDSINPAHSIKSDLPLKTIGGKTLVAEDVELPV